MKNKTAKELSIRTMLILFLGLASATAGLQLPEAQKPGYGLKNEHPNPRPGQPGHRPHEEWTGEASDADFDVVSSFAPPHGFLGNLTYDPESGRLFLISLGPPTNTKGPSTLYEVDPDTGKVLAQKEMPFKGDFGSPVYVDGFIYQGIFHESTMYKVDVRTPEDFGRIVATVPLPTLNDLKLVDESHPFPFIEFGGVTVTPDKKIMLHSDDTGELITIEPETGVILSRVSTIKALGGITAAPGPEGELLVLGNSDPRGGYCALSYPPESSRSPEQKDISWALLDARSGEVLASIRRMNSRAYASAVSLMDYDRSTPDRYGRYTFLATGEEGILKIQWAPKKGSY